MIISNTCFAGYIYTTYHKIFNHPFIWNFMYLDDYISLIENFKDINFLNITDSGQKIRNFLYRDHENNNLMWVNRLCHFLEIDGLIKIYYSHYRIEKYTIDEVKQIYLRRANRINKNDNILFTYNFPNRFVYEFEYDYLKKLYKLKENYNILIFNDIKTQYMMRNIMFFNHQKVFENNKEIFERYLL